MASQRPGGVLAQHLEVPRRVRVAFESGRAGRIQLEVGRIDDDVAAGELAELDQLRRGERGLRRAAAGEHDDLLDPGADDGGDRRVGGVGRAELLRGQREHPRHVDRDVSGADDHDALDGQVEVEVLVVGVAVVPGDELGRGPRAGQVLAGNPHAAVALGTDGVDDGVVQLDEVGVVDVAAHLDVAEEAEARAVGDLLEGAGDRLDLGMVGGDPEPDEPPRRRQPLDHVHLDRNLAAEQRPRRIEPGRPGPDDADAQRLSRAHCFDRNEATTAPYRWSLRIRITQPRGPEARASAAALAGGRTKRPGMRQHHGPRRRTRPPRPGTAPQHVRRRDRARGAANEAAPRQPVPAHLD